jgi:hypothetical protein
MAKKLTYITKSEYAELGFFDRPTLRAQRLKPMPDQKSVGEYWQGHGTVLVYDINYCVPMRKQRRDAGIERQKTAQFSMGQWLKMGGTINVI